MYVFRSSDNDVSISEAYAVKDGPLRSQLVGAWSIQGGLTVPEPQIYERRRNLTGVTLINGLLNWYPITDFERAGNGTLVNVRGLMPGAFRLLQQVF